MWNITKSELQIIELWSKMGTKLECTDKDTE